MGLGFARNTRSTVAGRSWVIRLCALLMLLGMQLRSDIYFEAALVIAMLGFVGTLALSRYVMRRDIIE